MGARFTKIAEDTFKHLVINAGVVCKAFAPETGTVTGIVGSTKSGISFDAKPSFIDMGSDIDNCPPNLKGLKKIDVWTAVAKGTYVTITPEHAKELLAAADISGNKITPRSILKLEDFEDRWIVGDYSDENNEEKGGFIAIHLMNSLSTGGFAFKTVNKGNGEFAFEYTAHYDDEDPDKVPFEIYIKAGEAVSA